MLALFPIIPSAYITMIAVNVSSSIASMLSIVCPLKTKAALTWAAAEMRQRYAKGWSGGKLIIAIDEFQEYTRDADFVSLLRKLASQGRAAGVHLLLSTQHPALEIFGDVTIRRNITGRIALKTADYEASKVATGR